MFKISTTNRNDIFGAGGDKKELKKAVPNLTKWYGFYRSYLVNI
jgi:hypothetical protein